MKINATTKLVLLMYAEKQAAINKAAHLHQAFLGRKAWDTFVQSIARLPNFFCICVGEAGDVASHTHVDEKQRNQRRRLRNTTPSSIASVTSAIMKSAMVIG